MTELHKNEYLTIRDKYSWPLGFQNDSFSTISVFRVRKCSQDHLLFLSSYNNHVVNAKQGLLLLQCWCCSVYDRYMCTRIRSSCMASVHTYVAKLFGDSWVIMHLRMSRGKSAAAVCDLSHKFTHERTNKGCERHTVMYSVIVLLKFK